MIACVVCSQPFQPRHARQRCCYTCPDSKLIDGKYHIQKRCEVCQELFHTSVFSQRTCSHGCGVRLGNYRRELTADAIELAERLDDARVASVQVSVTALRRRLSPAQARSATTCPACRGRILHEPDEYDVITLTCMQCGRVFGQVRPQSHSTRFGWSASLSKD